MNDLKELALAAVEAEKHYTVHPAIMAFHDAATPERILQYRNEVLEEAWQAVSTCLPDLPTSQQQELMAYFAYAIEALKTKEPA
jgi:hypothetical protein